MRRTQDQAVRHGQLCSSPQALPSAHGYRQRRRVRCVGRAEAVVDTERILAADESGCGVDVR